MLEKIAFSFLSRLRRLEAKYFKKRMNVGKKVRLRRPLVIQYPENIYVEDNVSMNRNCTFLAHGKIFIGKNAMIGPNVTIITVNHDYRAKGLKAHTSHVLLPVRIGENVWIGANALILPGITIGRNAIIGAGSVVTKDIGDGEVFAGNPARFIKRRLEQPSQRH